jgi:hypothetical protein
LNPLAIVNPMAPEATVQNATVAAKGAAQLVGYAMGLTDSEMSSVARGGVPVWAIVLVSAGAGALVMARWAPEYWIGKIRTFGMR